MATITRQIGGEEGVYTIEMDYSSTSLKPTAIRGDLINCPFDVYAETEHGIFSQAATGGGTLLDRSVFSAVNVVSGDSLQSTYTLTLTSGG